MMANSTPSMSMDWDVLDSCSVSFDSGSPPDKPMMITPTKAKIIPYSSKLEIRSFNQMKARIAVVNMLELKTTKNMPRGTNLEPAVRKKKATA